MIFKNVFIYLSFKQHNIKAQLTRFLHQGPWVCPLEVSISNAGLQ